MRIRFVDNLRILFNINAPGKAVFPGVLSVWKAVCEKMIENQSDSVFSEGDRGNRSLATKERFPQIHIPIPYVSLPLSGGRMDSMI